MISIITSNLVWSHGLYLLIVLGALGCIAAWLYRPSMYVFICAVIGLFYFFRNPERSCPQALIDNTILVCPADGTVVDVQHGDFQGFAQKVSIFLSFADAHVQWAPMAGVVDRILYSPGLFTLAFLPKSSLDNEHNDLYLTGDNGRALMLRQIAGTMTRRIVWWVAPADHVMQGQSYGMITFGSRVDIFVPASVKLAVGIGQHVWGGQTLLGHWIG